MSIKDYFIIIVSPPYPYPYLFSTCTSRSGRMLHGVGGGGFDVHEALFRVW